MLTSGPADISPPLTPPMTDDPYQWLEEVGGADALEWAKQQNALTLSKLDLNSEFKASFNRLLSIYDSKARIPGISKHGDYYYNFWRDASHIRGLWRRTSLNEYQKSDPEWETVIDLDALALDENENWVWKSANWQYPSHARCLISLSRGGSDAAVVREFDANAKAFLRDGFELPEAKSIVAWADEAHLWVASDFGPGSLTDSGYPRVVKNWVRGSPLEEAVTVFEAQISDVSVSVQVTNEPGFHHVMIGRASTFYTSENYLLCGGELVKLDVPDDAEPSIWRDQLLVQLRTGWTTGGTTWAGGSLIVVALSEFLAHGRDFMALFTPTPRSSLSGFSSTRHHLILETLDNVRSKLIVVGQDASGWTRTPLPAANFGALSAVGADPDRDDSYFLTVTDFLTPTSLYLASAKNPERLLLKQLPAFFNVEGLQIAQHHAISRDGTPVPYFEVSREDLKLDGSNPTLLYGYGGFEISLTPGYIASVGTEWLEKGGVYVQANIRGGGEFGPAWHESAIKQNRQRAFDDFAAIAEDLIARNLTSPRHLGIQGGSNGGLLVGVMLTQRPELFNAVLCQVPLLDMRRYHKLLAGASWMGEYGDPDQSEDWAYISQYSPYHNVMRGKAYPRVLFMTSTRDDRVHPGHARKMASRMQAQGHDVLYFENIEGGHGGAANNQQAATMGSLAYSFLWQQLR